ncbi:MAG: molybdopterin molybdotransferase [Planctomycetota bacterium]
MHKYESQRNSVTMIEFEEALELLRALPAAGGSEVVPLMRAAGRVTTRDVLLDRDQPGFDRATMDGYALALIAGQAEYRVIGTLTAGTHHDGELAAGDALRIMTGAPCPKGAGGRSVTVVPIELTDAGEERVRIEDAGALVAGRNLAWQGEDGHAGDCLVRAGTRLGPATLSVAAMAGVTEIEVFADPRVAIVTTGDEVGGSGSASIRDSNGPLLEALLSAVGCSITREHARDEEDELAAALRRATEAADIVVTTGGVSMGSRDLVPDTIAELGYETVFHKVAVQPGKPVLIARHPSGSLFCGLPGNPVSVLVTAHLFLLEAIARFQDGWRHRWLKLRIAEDYLHRGRRHLFLPATLAEGGVHPVRWNGSGDLIAAASADGIVDLPVGSDLKAGDFVSFLPYVGHTAGQGGVLPARSSKG